jgi:hypothetical protein
MTLERGVSSERLDLEATTRESRKILVTADGQARAIHPLGSGAYDPLQNRRKARQDMATAG